MRLTFGECGGYKYIIRKPKKKKRHKRIKKLVIGAALFSIAFFIATGEMIHVAIKSRSAGDDLINHNKIQI